MTTLNLPATARDTSADSSALHPACDPCQLHAFARNRWFDGKLLTTRDLEDEQDYLRGKDRLHSSLAHGIGTVCGLKVTAHPSAACQNQYVVLNPGLAYDCCGHEIIVQERKTIDLRDLIEGALRARQLFNDGSPAATNIYVRLAYREADADQVPALLDECGCGVPPREWSRTREGYELLVDLDEPAHPVSEPLEARLEWRNTLSVNAPAAMLVDRVLQRLYIAEWDGTNGSLRTYETEHHTMLSRASLGESKPTALACSLAGDLLYVALAADTSKSEIVIIDQQMLENPINNKVSFPTLTVDSASIVSLEIALRDDALLAVLDNGQIYRWANDTLRAWIDNQGAQPKPILMDLNKVVPGFEVAFPQDLFVPAATAQSVGPGGYWLVVADKNNPQLVVLNLAQFTASNANAKNFMQRFRLPDGRFPTAVEFSYDGKYLYVLCASTHILYRINVRDRLDTFIPQIPSEKDEFSELPLCDSGDQNSPKCPEFRDLSIAPRDSWAYLLCTDPAQPKTHGQVMVVSTEGMGAYTGLIEPPSIAASLRKMATSTLGMARCQTLAFSGQRLYVAGDTFAPQGQPEAGSVSIIDIEEDACGAYINRTIDGCPSCGSEDGVIIASIRGYQWNEPMVDDESATNYIDNYTYRPVAPSTSTLRQMIECILKKGISEGVPGPRGPQGIQGPAGRQGGPGPRGPGITKVDVQTLEAGQDATAELQSIPDDPEHDQALLLGIPRGQPGEAPKPTAFNQITGASWRHDEVMTRPGFMNRFEKLGLVIVFKLPVMLDTLTERSIFIRLRRRAETPNNGLGWESELVCRAEVQPVRVTLQQLQRVSCLSGSVPKDPGPLEQYAKEVAVTLVTRASAIEGGNADDAVSAARLALPVEMDADSLRDFTQMEVVVRGDWVVDQDNRPLDGHHIWPFIPERPSGNGAGGGDWISVIHFSMEQK